MFAAKDDDKSDAHFTRFLEDLASNLKGKTAAEQKAVLDNNYKRYLRPHFEGNHTLISLEVTIEYLHKLAFYGDALLKNLIDWMWQQTENKNAITSELIHNESQSHWFKPDGQLCKIQLPKKWIDILTSSLQLKKTDEHINKYN